MEGYWRDLRFLFGTKLQVLLLRVVVIYVHNRREWYVSLFSVVPHWHRSLVWLSRLLVPQPEIPPTPNAVEAQSLKHWITREVPGLVSSEDSKNADVRIFYHPNSLTPWVEEFYVDPGQGPRFGVLLMWTGSTGITASTASRISTPHQTQVSESTFQQKSLSYLCAHRNLTSHAKQMFSEVKATENCVLEQDWKGLAANLFLSISLPFITSFLRWRTVEPSGDVGTMAAADIVSVRPWGPPSGQGQGCSHPLQVVGGPGRFCSLGRGSQHLSTTISGTVDPGQYASGGRLFGPQTQIQFSNPGIPAWKQQ